MTLVEGDTVIMSSRAIPGNEPQVMQIMARLLRRGVLLRTWWSDRGLHVSGHAHRQEQQRMIDLVEPRSFVPVHGTLHHLLRHAALAREAGVAEVTVLENGDVGALDAGAEPMRKSGRIPVGRVHVFAGRALPAAVLRDRQALAANGVVHVVVSLDAHGRPAGELLVSTRGVVDPGLDGHVLEAVRDETRAALAELSPEALDKPAHPDAEAAEAARLRHAAGRWARILGFKPVTTVAVLRLPG